MVRIKVGALIGTASKTALFLTRLTSKRKPERICANGKVLPVSCTIAGRGQ